MIKSKLLISTALLAASSFSAQAQVISVSFTGNVTDLGNELTGDGVALGSDVSGSFSYDTNISGILLTFDIAIDSGFNVSMTGNGNLTVQNDQQNGSATLPADGMIVSSNASSSTSLNGNSNPFMQFGLRKENVSGQLWNDTLSPDLADWANITLANINAPDWRILDFGLVTTNFWDDQIRWDVASFEVNAVPVPAAAWLFGSGLLGLLGVARQKNIA